MFYPTDPLGLVLDIEHVQSDPAAVGRSITYRIAVGPNEGRKAFTLQTLAAALETPAGE